MFCNQRDICGDTEAQETPKLEKVNRLRARKDYGDHTDPVYRKISAINGEINRMTKDELKEKCSELKLETRGVKEVLQKRLKTYYKQRKLMKAKVKEPTECQYDFILVIDFEATCQENNQNYTHEIIEFPVILVDCHQRAVVDEFHEFCKPTINPRLTEFCTSLTGISQEVVDKADEFPVVFEKMQQWMESHCLGTDYTFSVLCDGPWDMSRFLAMQCDISRITFPKWARKWINVRKAYANYYQCQRMNLQAMLARLGMEFEGNLHCGLHDARNIARIAINLLEDGCMLIKNDFLHVDQSSINLNDKMSSKSEIVVIKEKNVKSEERSKEISEHLEKLKLENKEKLKLENKKFIEENEDLLDYFSLQTS